MTMTSFDRPSVVTAKPITIMLLARRVDCVDGVAAYLDNLALGLARGGDRVLLVSGPVSTPDGSGSRRDAIRASVLDWIVIEDWRLPVPRLRQIRRLLALVCAHQVDLLAPQGFSVLPTARLLAYRSGLPVVTHFHPSAHGDVASQISSRQPFRARLAYRAVASFCGADRYLAASRDIETFYRAECGVAPARIHYQPYPVDNDVFRVPSQDERRHARAAFGLPDHALVLVLSGRLNLVKGHDVVIDAVRELRTARPELQVIALFAGSGNQREQIERYALRDAVDRQSFHFLGFMASAVALRQVYWASDVKVLPSRAEGFAIVVPEAMFCGVVPVRTPSGGCADQIVDGENGFVVPFNDAAALADRLLRLTDPTLRARMGRRAVEWAEAHFTRQAMIDSTAALFHALVSRTT